MNTRNMNRRRVEALYDIAHSGFMAGQPRESSLAVCNDIWFDLPVSERMGLTVNQAGEVFRHFVDAFYTDAERDTIIEGAIHKFC